MFEVFAASPIEVDVTTTKAGATHYHVTIDGQPVTLIEENITAIRSMKEPGWYVRKVGGLYRLRRENAPF